MLLIKTYSNYKKKIIYSVDEIIKLDNHNVNLITRNIKNYCKYNKKIIKIKLANFW